MRSTTLTIVDPTHPGCPPLTMNQWRNAHHHVKTAAKHRNYTLVRAALGRSAPRYGRVRVSITQWAPTNRKRDADGLSAFRKDVLDALVHYGVIVDDNSKYVVDGGNLPEVDKSNPRIEIRIDELEARA